MGAYVNYSNRVEFLTKKWNGLMDQYSFEELDEQLVAQIVDNQRISTVQICEYIPESKLALVDKIFSARPDLTFRIYHFLDENQCDLRFLTKLPSVKKLSVDYIENVTHLEALKELSLTSLYLCIFDLKDYSILRELPLELEELSLYSEAKGKVNFDAEWLLRYENLKELYLGKLSKGIKSIQHIKSLKKLSLRGIKADSLEFLKNSNVTNLAVHWCSMSDLSSLQDNDKIEHFELWRVLKLEDLSFLNTMTNLKSLMLQDLSNIKEFPKIENCHSLQEIYLDNLKSLEKIDEICRCTSLNKFTMIGCQKLTTDDYKLLFETPNIEIIDIRGPGNNKKAKAIEEFMVRYNKSV